MHLNVMEFVGSFQYAGIWLASMVFAPELIMPLVGYLAWTGVISFVGGVMAGVVGATIGACGLYWFARAFRGETLDRLAKGYIPRLGNFYDGIASTNELHTPSDTARLISYKKLKYAVLVSRFVPAMRSAMSIPAGLQKMPIKTFVAYVAAGNVIWISILGLLGYAANVGYQSVQSSARHAALVAGGALTVAIIGRYIYSRFGRSKIRLRGVY